MCYYIMFFYKIFGYSTSMIKICQNSDISEIYYTSDVLNIISQNRPVIF